MPQQRPGARFGARCHGVSVDDPRGRLQFCLPGILAPSLWQHTLLFLSEPSTLPDAQSTWFMSPPGYTGVDGSQV